MERVVSEVTISEITVLSKKKIILASHRDDESIPKLQWEFGRETSRDKYIFSSPINVSKSTPLIFDIGGNLGFATISFAKFHEEAQIVVFEPNPFTYVYLLWNLSLNDVHVLTKEEFIHQVPGVYPVFGGLGGGSEYVVRIPMPREFPTRSQNNQARVTPETTGGDTNGVPIYSLPLFMKRYELMSRGIAIAKIDCECCEYPLISSNKELFSGVDVVRRIVGELHPFAACRSGFNLTLSVQQEVVDVLEKRGCGLSPDNFFDGMIGSAVKGEPCCPEFCPE